MSLGVEKKILIDFITQELDHNEDFFNHIFEMWVTECHDFTRHQTHMTTTNELIEIARLAHKIKSGSRSFGCLDLAALLQDIESAVQTNQAQLVRELCQQVHLELPYMLEDVRRISKSHFDEVNKNAS